MNNKPNAADIICSGRLQQNREEDPGEYDGASATLQDVKNRSNLRPRWRPQGADLPPMTPQGGCGRCHPTLRHSKRRKPTKIGFAQATPAGLPLSERLIYRRRQPGHLIGRFVRSRGVPETRARGLSGIWSGIKNEAKTAAPHLDRAGHQGRWGERNALLSFWLTNAT